MVTQGEPVGAETRGERQTLGTDTSCLREGAKPEAASTGPAQEESEWWYSVEYMTPPSLQAVDSVQVAHEVQLRVVELETQLTSTRQSLMSKTDECEREALSTRRYGHNLLC